MERATPVKERGGALHTTALRAFSVAGTAGVMNEAPNLQKAMALGGALPRVMVTLTLEVVEAGSLGGRIVAGMGVGAPNLTTPPRIHCTPLGERSKVAVGEAFKDGED